MRRRGAVQAGLLAIVLLVLGTHVSAAPQPGRVHFAAVGDFGATADTGAVLDRMKASGTDLTLTMGDLSYGAAGEEQAWCDFVTSRVGAGYPFELLSGNHESGGLNGNINDFSACLPNQLPGVIGTYGKQYYVDVPADDPIARFIMISPALDFPEGRHDFAAGSPRYQWTERAIDGARSSGVPWVVVSMHKPCLTVGKYTCESGAALFNLLIAKKVDLILSGHEHTYQRSHQLGVRAGCTAIVPGAFNPACVVDSDGTFTAGSGSVAAVLGTGGNFLYDVNADDPEAGYFARTSGRNLNPTFGFLDVSATDTTLSGSFNRAAGGSAADSFTITRSAGPPNQPPAASFTSSCVDLVCTFDASGSVDPDGTVVSHAWDFGDQTSGSGRTPGHTYSTPGSYPVALTVTDDGGGSGTVSRTLVVTGPATTAYAADDFSRTVSSGWGTAPVGGVWTHPSSASVFSVGGGFGGIAVGKGSNRAAYLASVSAPATDLTTAVRLDKQVTGSGLYLSTFGRRVANQEAYYAKTRITGNGSVTLELCRVSAAGVETSLQTGVAIAGLTLAVGETLNLRVQTTGSSPTTLRARAWKAGSTEPTTWARSITDATAGLQGSGSVGVAAYLSSAATNAPLTVQVDSFSVLAP